MRWRWIMTGILLLGVHEGRWVRAQSATASPPALEGPVAGNERPAEVAGPVHEAFQAPGTPTARVRTPKEPPPPVDERAAGDRPAPEAQWVAGYWGWDASRNDFAWVPGAWVVPPRGMAWVGGRWTRDADGWTRTPGFWSPLRGVAAPASSARRPDWRVTGPPPDHPDDTPGAAPAPDAFLVPGHYRPAGDRLSWTPSYWARVRPGWDWVPARWVRRADGWDFREGYWAPEPSPADRQRHAVARPASPDASDLPPAIVESEPAGPVAGADRPPQSPPAEAPRDPIAEAEDAARAPTVVPPPVVVVPRGGPYPAPYPMGPPLGYVNGVPVRIIRPPGSYPYGPGGVVVPAITPPFVQRLLNRVLP
jgi:hypothetical protein